MIVRQPLAAAYISAPKVIRATLAITVHHLAADNASREILMTDIFTAFAQRLAGEEIVLRPVTTTWREWSQRCAALATHPAVLESRDFWLENAAGATLRVADQDTAEPPHANDLSKLSAALTGELTSEVDEARRVLRLADRRSAPCRAGPHDRRGRSVTGLSRSTSRDTAVWC